VVYIATIVLQRVKVYLMLGYTSIYTCVSQEISSLQVSRKKLYAFVILSMRATCKVRLILLDFVKPIMFGEEYTLKNSLGFFFLQHPVLIPDRGRGFFF
jgi:hypothetical protein